MLFRNQAYLTIGFSVLCWEGDVSRLTTLLVSTIQKMAGSKWLVVARRPVSTLGTYEANSTRSS